MRFYFGALSSNLGQFSLSSPESMDCKQQSILSPPQTSNFLHQDHHSTPPPPPPSTDFNLNKEVSPSILLSIIIISVIFFISGLLHLLIRILLRPSNRDPNDLDHSTDFQRQLQQLFHLHDSGVDQSLLDTLPVFNYKAIIGVKKYPFDCAVCLCEFELEDKLRLLPNCSHAFHRDCIDRWLLSHSTCPICRTSLLVGLSQNGHCLSPRVLVLESGSESAGENVSERDDVRLSLERLSSDTGFYCSDAFGSSRTYFSREIEAENDESRNVEVGSEAKVVLVKLGKFRNVDGRGGEGISSHGNNGDARRCFSMGSFAYVMDEKSLLQVPIIVPMKKESSKKGSLPLRSGHRPAMSECGFDSRREFTSFGQFKSVQIHGIGSNALRRSKSETFSGSKNWLRLKREMPNPTAAESSRRGFSFRFPVQHNVVGRDELKPKNCWNGTRRTFSEIDIGRWENMGGIEIVGDHSEGYQSCNILDSHENPQSLARKTMFWLVGRKNKVVHSSFSPNV